MQIAELFVRIRGDSQQLNKSLRGTQSQLRSFGTGVDSMNARIGKLGSSFGGLASVLGAAGVGLGIGAAISGLKSGLTEAWKEADAFDATLRKLEATAKITGQNLGFLQTVAVDAKEAFGISTATAAEFTTEVVKLTSKAGAIEKTGAAIGAFLDLGAARGMDAAGTLRAVQQAILGIDEGTDKLFGKNPSVIYKEFADAIGLSVGKMTDQQKALALLNAAMEDGGKVAGEFARWLESPAGQAFKLQTRMDELQAGIGRALNGVRNLALPILSRFVDWLAKASVKVAEFTVRIPLYFETLRYQLARANSATGGVISSIVDMMEGANDAVDRFLRRLPGGDAMVKALRFVDVADNAVRAAAAAARQSESDAAASLERVRKQTEETIARIRKEMSLAIDIVGPTNPLATFLDQVSESAEDAEKRAKALARALKSLDNIAAPALARVETLLQNIQKARADREAFAAAQLSRFETFGGTLAPVAAPKPPQPTDWGFAPDWSGVTEAFKAEMHNVWSPLISGLGTNFMSQLTQVPTALTGMLSGLAASFGPLAIAAAALGEIFTGMMQFLEPFLAPIIQALHMIGSLLGALIVPVLLLITPPLELLGKMASYVVEAMGWLIKSLGEFVDKIVPDWISKAGKPLAKAGEAMMKSAQDSRKAFDELRDYGIKPAEKELSNLSESVTNAVKWLNMDRLRYEASDELRNNVPGGGTVNIGPVQIFAQPGEDVEAFWDRLQGVIVRRERAGQTSRLEILAAARTRKMLAGGSI